MTAIYNCRLVKKRWHYDSAYNITLLFLVPVDSDDNESSLNPGDEASEDDLDDKASSWSKQNNSFGSSQLPKSGAAARRPLAGFPAAGSTGNVEASWRLNTSFGNASSVSSFSPRSNSSTSSRNGGGSTASASSAGSRNATDNRKASKTVDLVSSHNNLEQPEKGPEEAASSVENLS